MGLLVPLLLQSIEGLAAEVEDMRQQPSPLAAAQAAKQEVLADQRKFQEVIAGNQVSSLCCRCLGGVKLYVQRQRRRRRQQRCCAARAARYEQSQTLTIEHPS
jgi:hypothetical protein